MRKASLSIPCNRLRNVHFLSCNVFTSSPPPLIETPRRNVGSTAKRVRTIHSHYSLSYRHIAISSSTSRIINNKLLLFPSFSNSFILSIRRIQFRSLSSSLSPPAKSDLDQQQHLETTLPWFDKSGVPRNLWSSPANRIQFFQWAAKQFNIPREQPEQWYQISRKQIRDLMGGADLMTNNDSNFDKEFLAALSSIYPEIEWLPWRFKSGVPRGFWDDQSNQRRYFDWASKQLYPNKNNNNNNENPPPTIKGLEEFWYTITRDDLLRLGRGAASLLVKFNNSLIAALANAYPEIEWLPWRFENNHPRRFWSNSSNHRRFLEWAAKQLRGGPAMDMDWWYGVKPDDIKRLGGAGLIAYFGGSLSTAIMQTFPEHQWLPWRFVNGAPQGFWFQLDNQRRFLDWVAKQLGIDDINGGAPDGWYRVRLEDVNKLGGSRLMNIYGNSLVRALVSVYPEIEFLPWRFAGGCPNGFWTDESNQRRFLEYHAQRDLGIREGELEDWYRVTAEDISKLGGGGLLKQYGNSLHRLLSRMYPQVEWLPWRFASGTPRGFWNDRANRLWFFQWLEKQLSIKQPSDWYKVSQPEVCKMGGAGLINNHYDGSLTQALADVYPDFDWVPWGRGKQKGRAQRGCWGDRSNHRKFFDRAAAQLGVTVVPGDWYRVQPEDIAKLGGQGLLQRYYNGSLIQALSAVYPEVEWLPWRFSYVPRGFWSDRANHRRFFDWAAKEMGFTIAPPTNHNDNNNNNNNSDNNNDDNNSQQQQQQQQQQQWAEQWYSITRDDLFRLGGSGLLTHFYDGNVAAALAAVYPEIQWQPWRFRGFKAPTYMAITSSNTNTNTNTSTDDNIDNNNNNNRAELRRYMDHVATTLRVGSLDEWYRVTMNQIRHEVGGSSIIANHGGLCAVLKSLYPDHAWDEERFHNARGKKSSQWQLRVALQKMFPDTEIVEEYNHPNVRFNEETSSETVTFDIWIPSLALAFEYQGQHHYHDTYHFGDPSKQRRRDAEKREACARASITLVTVPYWWDRTVESLADMIRDASTTTRLKQL